MRFPEEHIAADLYQELIRLFCATTTSCSIKGAGFHWHCTAKRGNSNCLVHCFKDVQSRPEYRISFERDSVTCAIGRTLLRDRAVVAISDWLDGFSLSELYAKYPFVDKAKRTLICLLEEVTALEPEFVHSVQAELKVEYEEFYALLFKTPSRACRISIGGDSELPNAKCSWDDCELIQFQPQDSSQLAIVCKRWLSEEAMPSALRTEFPWLNIDELADSYEKGQPIQDEFLRSWDRVETHYLDLMPNFAASKTILEMVHAMRDAGYDRVLRAGQSLWSLVLSRSRRHGLRLEQHSICFSFHDSKMNVSSRDSDVFLKNVPIELSPDVRKVLDALVVMNID